MKKGACHTRGRSERWYGGAALSDRSSSGWLRIEKQGSAHGATLFSWQSTRYLASAIADAGFGLSKGGAVVQLSLGGESGADGERWCGDAKVIGT
ncbi:unnamed protein product [Lactuca virosa]|uniref:Uncharacterized protein n=1 Tax=Lactuca virosa TaxID=75947 RepID=A0AAU9PQP2_9ASTR|nr:unnamed protein product [Lactuca virosa]